MTRHVMLALVMTLLLAASAVSQVRTAPAGNDLPESTPSVDLSPSPTQPPLDLPSGHTADDGRDHGSAGAGSAATSIKPAAEPHCAHCAQAEKAAVAGKTPAADSAAGPTTGVPIDPHGGRDPYGKTNAYEQGDPHAGHDHGPHAGHDHAAHASPGIAADTGGPVELTNEERQAFEEAVDLDQFRKLAVFDNGRAKIVDTLAREQVNKIFGKERWQDTSGHKYDPVFSYLDLIFAPESYWFEPLIYVEVLELRRSMVAHMPQDEQDLWLRRGRLAPAHFMNPEVRGVLEAAGTDLQRRKGHDQVIRSMIAFDGRLAMQSQPMGLQQTLMMVSPVAGSDHWSHVAELSHMSVAAAGDMMAAPQPIVADPQLGREVLQQFQNLAVAWRAQDADAVNAALGRLTADLPRLNPTTYPSDAYRVAERIYNATHKFTIGYVAYFFAAIALLIAFKVPRPSLIATGIALLLVAFAVHSAGIGVRAALAGRWPIHNQFESFIAVSWFAALVGILLMTFRKQWIFGAAAAAAGFIALLVANTTPIPSNEVGQVAGILGTSRILYVHVNIVLASYALITLGCFTSLFYLTVHYFPSRTTEQYVATSLGSMPVSVPADEMTSSGGAAGDAADDSTNASPTAPVGRQSLLNDLDHAQLVVLQLAFWTLGFGTLLGAYWADHAWGRFWAWDPKETWALITWIIYLIVIHVRFGVKRRGLVTAWLSVLGFISMLWCYWGVNLLLAGLHSYA